MVRPQALRLGSSAGSGALGEVRATLANLIFAPPVICARTVTVVAGWFSTSVSV